MTNEKDLAKIVDQVLDAGSYINGGAGDEVARVLWAAGWRKEESK